MHKSDCRPQAVGGRLDQGVRLQLADAPKERPILFSAPMVRALLDGTKTQTRRRMSVQPHDGAEVVCDDFYPTAIARNGDEEPGPEVFGAWWSDGEEAVRCPYGKPGERLWAREAFRLCAEADATPPRETDAAYRVWYESDAPHQPGFGKLRPSMFMPRWACRLVLTLENVRAERLNDISEADALAEGADMNQAITMPFAPGLEFATVTMRPRTAREAYAALWEQINGPGSWAANPWVWVVEFRRLHLQPNV